MTPELVVKVFAPIGVSKKQLQEAVDTRAEWIVTTMAKVQSKRLLSLPDRGRDGDVLAYLGREIHLRIVEGKRASDLFFDTLVVTMPNPDDEQAIARAIDRWYRAEANRIFDRHIREGIQAAAFEGLTIPSVALRKMRSRWGSCSSDGRVTLNLKLVMVPEPCIEYVVMHELCHLIHHNHSKRYYALLTECMPDWKARKKTLDGYRIK